MVMLKAKEFIFLEMEVIMMDSLEIHDFQVKEKWFTSLTIWFIMGYGEMVYLKEKDFNKL